MPVNLLPPTIDEPGLLVGYSIEEQHRKTPFGFSFGDEKFTPQGGYLDPYLFHGEGHLITIAPTGAGKGVASVIPAALRHQGDLVVIDPKGENFAITADRRMALGQEICLVDPFGITKSMDIQGVEPGGINVFDLLPYLADNEATSSQALAGMLFQGSKGKGADPFWDMSATNILAGLIDFYANDPRGGTVHDLLDDLFRFPAERNRIVPLKGPIERKLEQSPELEEILKRFSIYPWQIEEAYREHRELQRGNQSTRRILTVEQQRLMSDNEMDAFFITSEKEVQVSNRDFSTAIRDFSGAEPDDRTVKILLEIAKNSISDVDAQVEIQNRVNRFLSAAEAHELAYPIAILRMMSSNRDMPERVSAMIASTPDKTWGSMISVLHNGMSYLNSSGIRSAISRTSMDLDRFRDGVGTSIYLVFPPHRLVTHSQLLSTLFKGLINVLVARQSRPQQSTLFLMDEVAQLGYVEEFVSAKTLLRGYGVQVWSFWQDLSQLQSTYPNIWPTLINNCKVFQAFGCATPMMASAMEDIFMIPAATVLDLEKDEMLLSIYGDDPVIARKPTYYSDPAFDGIFAENPMLNAAQASSDRSKSAGKIEDEPQKPIRKFVLETRSRKIIHK